MPLPVESHEKAQYFTVIGQKALIICGESEKNPHSLVVREDSRGFQMQFYLTHIFSLDSYFYFKRMRRQRFQYNQYHTTTTQLDRIIKQKSAVNFFFKQTSVSKTDLNFSPCGCRK